MVERYVDIVEARSSILLPPTSTLRIAIEKDSDARGLSLYMKTTVETLKKLLGVLLMVLGLLALLTPLTPGSWLIFVGAELLGVRLVLARKIKDMPLPKSVKRYVRKNVTNSTSNDPAQK